MSKTKTTLESEIEAMITGFQSALPTTVKSVPLAGEMLTPVQAIQKLQGYDLLFTRVASNLAAYKQSVVDRKAQEPEMRNVIKGLRAFVSALFPPTLKKFGAERQSPTAISRG